MRPDQFGYYATRWRSWPGQSVKQVSHFDPATTPVTPPAAEVPGMDEEERAFPDEEGDGEAMDDESLDESLDDDAAEAMPAADGGAPAGGAEAGSPPANGLDRAAEEAPADRDAAATPPEFAEPDTEAAPSRGRKAADDGSQQESPDRLLDRTSLEGPGRGGAVGRSRDVIPASAPSSQPARDVVLPSDRRAGYPDASGTWRPSGRRGSSDPNAANPLRGVTTQPGNPLR